MKPYATLGLITGIFLMLLALGIWSASHHPARSVQAGVAPQSQATLATADPAPVTGP